MPGWPEKVVSLLPEIPTDLPLILSNNLFPTGRTLGFGYSFVRFTVTFTQPAETTRSRTMLRAAGRDGAADPDAAAEEEPPDDASSTPLAAARFNACSSCEAVEALAIAHGIRRWRAPSGRVAQSGTDHSRATARGGG